MRPPGPRAHQPLSGDHPGKTTCASAHDQVMARPATNLCLGAPTARRPGQPGTPPGPGHLCQSAHFPNAHRGSSAGSGVPRVPAETDHTRPRTTVTEERVQRGIETEVGRQPAAVLRTGKPCPWEAGLAPPLRRTHALDADGYTPATNQGAKSPEDTR